MKARLVRLSNQPLKRQTELENYHALLSLTKDEHLNVQTDIDARLAKGEDVGDLAGVPFVAKDNFLAFGSPTTAASKMLEHFDAPLQATAIEKT